MVVIDFGASLVDGTRDSLRTKDSEIVYVRDMSSESAMVKLLAAESIQDAYR